MSEYWNPRIGLALVVAGWVAAGIPALAAEHGGREHAGQEHAGSTTTSAAVAPSAQPTAVPAKEHGGESAQAAPTASQLRERIESYVKERSAKTRAFDIKDEVTGTVRHLTFVRVHQRVGKTGTYYYSCTDMRDAKTGELLDLDFDVEARKGRLDVVDVRIHKVNSKPRYTYDEHDNRVPVPMQ